ncbi:MAG: 3-hydroxyacyl-CoA dehydrogenase NAD-binding domain-containing protein [Actinomycetota bacterium]
MAAVIERAAIVGAGVIGSAWAARFALHGVDVKVLDPNPDTERILGEVFDNARAAWAALDLPDVAEGSVELVETYDEACNDAEWVQESAPENVEMKRSILRQIDDACDHDAVIASSTSGIKPSDLQEGMSHPWRLLVGHPFNPVYLLPLVEVCAGEQTTRASVDRAVEVYASVSMKPLEVRVEIDAFIADRLLEAVWRESLWLVNDGVATTEEIDDAIRYGFGLRWAQMGLFETYRVAGGEGGMGHFVRQFGPTLSWPWTKLMDVPELTDELVDRIEAQSDAQSGAHSIRELERIRDRNLVGILRALETNDWGAGETLARQRRSLSDD